MADYFKKTGRAVFVIIVIFILISCTNNMRLESDYLRSKSEFILIAKSDLINRVFTHVSVTDISELFTAREDRDTTEFIVVHHAGVVGEYTPLDVDKFHKEVRGWSGIAYTYWITSKGKVFKNHGIDERTASEKGYNNKSLSICLQGDFDLGKPSQSQINSLVKLVIKLKLDYPSARLVGHKELNKTPCPGTYLNIEKVDSITRRFHIINKLFN